MKKKKPPLPHRPATFFGLQWPDDPNKPEVVIQTELGHQKPAPATVAPSLPTSAITQASQERVPTAAARPSSLTDLGILTRVFLAGHFSLIVAYVATSTSLPDDSVVKPTLYLHAKFLVGIALAFAVFEIIRTSQSHKSENFGRLTRFSLVAFPFIVAFGFFAGVVDLLVLHSDGYVRRVAEHQRIEQQQKSDELERLRIKRVAQDECESARAKDVETLTRRRNAANADNKKCQAEWVKPSILSSETAVIHCAPKLATYNKLAQAVRERQTNVCTQFPTGSIK